MSEENATGVIIGSVLVITSTTIIRNAKNKKHLGRTWEPVIWGFLLALALLAIAIFAPKFAKGLAYLGLVGAFALNGPTIFGIVQGLGGSGKTSGSGGGGVVHKKQ